MVKIYRGWIVTASTFVILFLIFGISYSFGIFFHSFQVEFSAGREAVSWIFSIHVFLLFITGAFFGWLSDRIGPRKVIMAGVLLISTGLFLSGFAESITHLYITFGVVVSLGIGAVYVPSVATMQQWFVRKAGTAAGLANAGIGMGNLVIALIGAHLLILFGWRVSFLIFGLVSLIALSIASIFQIPPEDIRGSSGPSGISGLVLSSSFILLFVAIFLGDIPIYISLTHIVPYSLDRGVTETSASVVLGMIGGAGIAGRLGMGIISDKIGRKVGLMLCFAGMGGSIMWLVIADTYLSLLIFSIVFGFSYGGFVALLSPFAMDLFGKHSLGAVIGLLYASAGFGALIAPSMAGRMFDMYGSYTIPFITGGLASFIAIILMVFIKSEKNR